MSDENHGALSRRTVLGAMAASAALAGCSWTGETRRAPARVCGREKVLSTGWRMQAAGDVNEGGATLSRIGYPTQKWYGVTVPCTVLAGLVENGEYPELFFGENLKEVPVERFAGAWWYRAEFEAEAGEGRRVWLGLKGVNYRANVWVNGALVAGKDRLVGTYSAFELDITSVAKARNAVAIEVFPPDPEKDLAITFVDWAPAPPDRNMGVWQDVVVRTSGAVTVREPFVGVELEVPSLNSATLTGMADLFNASDREVPGVLEGVIAGRKVSRKVTLGAGERRTVEMEPFALGKPKVWWPWQLGAPEMHEASFRFVVDGEASDEAGTRFGVRKVTSRLDNGHRLFTVNGVDLLILGGGYSPDLLQRRAGQERHVRYVRDMNLNTVRLEGKLEDDAFYDLCDEAGILVMPGWCCCSPWEKWKSWKEEQRTVAMASLRTQIRRARNHPSMLAWLNGSDNHPPADVERAYLAIEEELRWPCPTISSATGKKTEVSGESGVKMLGPYQWEPPVFWYWDKKTGGAWGFNTEVGPGPVPPPAESIAKMLPEAERWPIGKGWDYHCGGGAFGNVGVFKKALDARFGESRGLADFSWKAQAQAYETIRAMFEAFRRNKFVATGEIQWMLNNAWPSMIWHLYDYYWRPGAAYFATKVACRPVSAVYDYAERSVHVVNDTMTTFGRVHVMADVRDLRGKVLWSSSAVVRSAANASAEVMKVPPIEGAPAYFLRLRAVGAEGETPGVNDYWLSAKAEVMGANGGKDDWNMTPVAEHADYRALETLPKVELQVGEVATRREGEEMTTSARVRNASRDSAAMMACASVRKGKGGEEVLPVRWSDNYVTLMPGESRALTARYLRRDIGDARPHVTVDCFNNGRTP